MRYYSTAEKLLFENSSTKTLTLTFGDGTVLDNDDIYYESMKIEQVLCDDTVLRFGSCGVSEFNIKIYNIPASHIGQSLEVKITATIGNDSTTKTLGKFIVVEDKLTDDKMYREIKAYDAMYVVKNADVTDWYNALWEHEDGTEEVTMTLKQFRDSFFEHLSLDQVAFDGANDNVTIKKTIDAEKISGKDVLFAICEINSCFAIINEFGKVKYITFIYSNDTLFPANTLYPANNVFPMDAVDANLNVSKFINGTLKYEDYTCKRIKRVQIRETENDIGVIYGQDGNTYVIEDNFLLYGKGSIELETIASKWLGSISYIEYNEASVGCRAMPWIELGDYIKVVGERDTVYLPVMKRTMSGIQALKDVYESFGKETYPDEVNGVHSDIIKLKGKSNELTRTIEQTQSTITDVESSLTSKITQQAGRITSEISRAQGAESSLSSRITQTDSDITAEVKRAKKEEGSLSSKITQTAESIESKVSKDDYNGGEIVSRINQTAEEVTIDANKINLNGAVTANNNFKINTDGSIVAQNATFTGSVTSSTITGGSINIGSGRFCVNSNGNITTTANGSQYTPEDSFGIAVWVVGDNGNWMIPRSMNFVNGLFVGWGNTSQSTRNCSSLPTV